MDKSERPFECYFVAIEGTDGTGTTTQAALLAKALTKEGLTARSTHEPTPGPIGSLIRQVLNGRVVVEGPNGSKPLNWKTMALLFAADRIDHLEAEVEPALRDGITIITDRYDASSIAYQGTSLGENADEATIEWVRTLNARARRPDLTIILDVTPEVSRARRLSRGIPLDIFEHEEIQDRLAKFYLTIEEYLPGDQVVHVDGNGTVEEVHDRVFEAVRAFRAWANEAVG